MKYYRHAKPSEFSNVHEDALKEINYKKFYLLIGYARKQMTIKITNLLNFKLSNQSALLHKSCTIAKAK